VITNPIMRVQPGFRSPAARRQRNSLRFGAGRGTRRPRYLSAAGGGPGSLAAATVTGFSTDSDAIASATPDGPTGYLLATSMASGGNIVVTFADGSTMTLVGIANITKVSFIR
jgi:hypothetical protein